MCHLIYVSTDSGQDLAALTSDEYVFLKVVDKSLEEVSSELSYDHVWFLASKYGGCSCHYRNLPAESVSLGFAEPEEWFPEDEDDIASTKAAYDVFAALINQGCRMDVINLWDGAVYEEINQVEVSLSRVPRNAFRFWEGSRFELVP